MQARNAHFNLNRLGVTVSSYAANFYGTDYPKNPEANAESPGIDSDRLFANWNIRSARVQRLAERHSAEVETAPDAKINIPTNWAALLKENPRRAKEELLRTRSEFQRNFDQGLVCAGFERGDQPHYLLYRREVINE